MNVHVLFLLDTLLIYPGPPIRARSKAPRRAPRASGALPEAAAP